MSYSPWGNEESDMTERLHFHFSLSCFGEGNGNLLQCSCLENPREGEAWWAALYGTAQSWTRLKRLSSSSSDRGETLFQVKNTMYDALGELRVKGRSRSAHTCPSIQGAHRAMADRCA